MSLWKDLGRGRAPVPTLFAQNRGNHGGIAPTEAVNLPK
ncbi:MAG: thioredoxin [Prochlorothrix sp.]